MTSPSLPLKSGNSASAKNTSKAKIPAQRKVPTVAPSVPSKELHVFPNPAPERDYLVEFVVPEFTCHCPLTGQPDFAHFTIQMVADKLCIELKSLKMFFWSFRNEGAFHEKITNDILNALVKVTDPRFCRIRAKWNVRGGIYTNVSVEHRKKGWKAVPLIESQPEN
jgi:7-cyano-7-deazaguanine reductase